MIIEFISKSYEPNERIKDVIIKKVEKLDKYFESDTKVKVMFKQSKDIYTLEFTIVIDNVVLRAEVFSDNMYNNIDIALPKLEKQIIKHHKRIISRTKKVREKALVEAEPVTEKHNVVVKSKRYQLVPMTVEDAIEEQELVGHSFFVFLNKANHSVNILYRRNDGDYGLIETDVQG